MLAKGNGKRERCAANLARTVAGEVPYERAKGVDRRIFDTPTIDRNMVRASVSQVISRFEPRIDSCTVTLAPDDAQGGNLVIRLAIE